MNKTEAALKSFDDMRLDWRLSEIVGKKIGEQTSQQLGFDRKFYGCAAVHQPHPIMIAKSANLEGAVDPNVDDGHGASWCVPSVGQAVTAPAQRARWSGRLTSFWCKTRKNMTVRRRSGPRDMP